MDQFAFFQRFVPSADGEVQCKCHKTFPVKQTTDVGGSLWQRGQKQYLAMGIVVIFLSVGMVVIMLVNAIVRGQDIARTPLESILMLLVCLIAVVEDILGGYMVGEYRGLEKGATHPSPTRLDCAKGELLWSGLNLEGGKVEKRAYQMRL
jgi:hypothetical protein